ncbi:hypothetical protein [Pelosinus sp. sgz500959]|uniref:hypothetical protein n=1 Tax=Pelosinus sp. sgz500959 TaxID=3242472 RepID=UPI00366CC64C
MLVVSWNYEILASVPGYVIRCHHKARLQNITDSTTTLLGTSEAGSIMSYWSSQWSVIQGLFTISTARMFEIQHVTNTGHAGSGFGIALAFAGINEIYTVITIRKIA